MGGIILLQMPAVTTKYQTITSTPVSTYMHAHTEEDKGNWAKFSQRILLITYTQSLRGPLKHQYSLSPFNSPGHSACLSISFMSIKVPLNPLLRSHNVNAEQKECIQVRSSEVWGYSAEISHWRKVNMVGVMRLEPD